MHSLPVLEIILISLGLSADAFSVALAAGAQGFTPRRIFRLSWHFGLFQFLMPVIGWTCGDVLSKHIGNYGKWIVLVLLAIIGGKMIIDGLKGTPQSLPDLSRGWNLVTLSICTSLDALCIGFGLGILDVFIFKPAAIIGIICAITTIIGLYLGVRLYKHLGHRAVILGGLILITIGIKMAAA